MKCRNPECGEEINDNSLFCWKCGTIAFSRCTVCGKELPVIANMKFCPECGTAFSEMNKPANQTTSDEHIEAQTIDENQEEADSQSTKEDDIFDKASKAFHDVKTSITENKKYQEVVSATSKALKDAKTTISESKTYQDAKEATSKALHEAKESISKSKTYKDVKASIKGISSKNWATIIHPIGSVLYILLGIISLSKTNELARLLFAGILGSLITLMGISAVVSVIGLLFKKTWAYLVSAIIQSIAFFMNISLLLSGLNDVYIIIALIIIGFIAYKQSQKLIPSVPSGSATHTSPAASNPADMLSSATSEQPVSEEDENNKEN